MIIKTFYDRDYHEVEVKEGDMVKISYLNGKNWLILSEGQLVQRNFKEGSLACGQSTWGIHNGYKFEPLINFSSNYVKVEVL